MIVFMRHFTRPAGIAAALLAGLSVALVGSGTQTWEMDSYSDFVAGHFDGVSLSREGRLSLAPKVDTVFTSDQPVIWSVAQASDGTLYAGTGNRGRLYRIDPAGKSSLLWTAEQPEIFAVTVDANGVVYAGTSPEGKVYRIVNGKAEEYFAPQARYIWSLAVAPDGALFVGTGDQGKIFRVEGPGKGEVYYDTGQSHITGMAVDSQGRLLAGTEPNGILYRITAKDKAFALYDSSLPEIRSIVPMPDGTVYAAALGGSVAKRAQAAQQAAQGMTGIPTIASTTITVEAQAGGEIKPPEAKPQHTAGGRAPGQHAGAAGRGHQRRRQVRHLSHQSRQHRGDPLEFQRGERLRSAGAARTRCSFPPTRTAASTGSRRTCASPWSPRPARARPPACCLPSHSILAATGNMGHIYRLGEKPGASGSYEAPVHDSGTASRWGSLSWRADVPAGCGLVFRTRSGNSARPDRTWSDWSGPLTDSAGARIASPNARYIQWKVEMSGSCRRYSAAERHHPGLPAAEFAAGGAEHQRHQPGLAHLAGFQVLRQLLFRGV